MLEASWFICNNLYFVLYCYLFSKLICNEKFTFNIKILIMSFLVGIIYYIFTSCGLIYIRPYIIHLYLFFSLHHIYKKNFAKTLLGILSIFILCLISELLFGFITINIFKINYITFNTNPLNCLVSNILIYIITLLISNVKLFKKIISSIISWYNENEFKSSLILTIMAMSIGLFVIYNNFINYLPNYFLIFLNIFCISVIIFVVGFFKEKSNNNRIITEYDQLLEYVKTYEKLVETKSKNQHEYKNQLILIKGMTKSKEAISYIDKILKNEKDDYNIELLKKLHYLPQGGLKGLIYYKIEQMIDKKIDVYVDISSNLKNTKVLKDNLQDISKIIGVYLDNAIEAALNADKKYIIIESYMEDDNIVFKFSNTYKESVDLNKVDKEGYTTKGEGKGYGLSLVKDILENNKTFSQERELNGIYYVQKLYIKNKA